MAENFLKRWVYLDDSNTQKPYSENHNFHHEIDRNDPFYYSFFSGFSNTFSVNLLVSICSDKKICTNTKKSSFFPLKNDKKSAFRLPNNEFGRNIQEGIFQNEDGVEPYCDVGFMSLSMSLKENGNDISIKDMNNNGDREKKGNERDYKHGRHYGACNVSKHLWSGAVSAMVSRTVVAPLERLKLEYLVRGESKSFFDLIHHIVTKEGVRSFWKGNAVNILRTAPFKSINFCAYEVYRKKLLEWTKNEEPTNSERFFAGAAAGITATILCLPLDTIRTKMIARGGETLGGVTNVCQHIVQTEGFFSLYKGLLPAIISVAPAGAVFYGVYDILKTSFLRSPKGKIRLDLMRKRDESNAFEQLELGPIRTLLYGAIAGAAAEAATYPFEVVRRHLQMQTLNTRLNTAATCAKIIHEGGAVALYAGLLPSMLQVLPSAAISYFVYECMKIILKVE